MDARLSPPSARRRRPWVARPWTLVVLALLVVGTLIQACTDNNGSTGPRFGCQEQKGGVKVLTQCTGSPAPTTGFANTAADIKVQVGVNPNTITPGRRAGVTAFVTNLNGLPLAGKTVQFSTDVGSLDQTVVSTNAQGQASTTLSITPTDVANAQGKTSATVTAFVEGAVGTGLVNFGPNSTLVIIPGTVNQTNTATAGNCSFTINFSASGGTPPYTFAAGISGNLVGTTYTATPAIGAAVTDTVTVTDSTGGTASSPVSLTCNHS
jgi:hypothetical protein